MKQGVKPGRRGWRGRGGGASTYLQVPPEWRATSVQTCGLFPYAAGAASPLIGVPLGRRLDRRGGTVCCDPLSWFQRAKLISNPSAFVLGLPGLGKSTVNRRWITGLAGYGVIPLVPGDLKGEYVPLIRALGGQVAPIGRGRGYLNPLDMRSAVAAADRLRATGHADAAEAVLADARGRRITVTGALLTIQRGGTPPQDWEESIIDRALEVIDRTGQHAPLYSEVHQVIRQAPAEVLDVAVVADLEEYRRLTAPLERSLLALESSGRLGGLFTRQTSESARPRMDRPMVYDTSSISETENDLAAAVLMVLWTATFGQVNVAHTLADAGLEPMRQYFAALDELWRPLRAGRGMVDRIDSATRLNRTDGFGQSMTTHTMSDLELADPADTAKARGFVARAGMIVAGGLPHSEFELLRKRTAARFSQAEQQQVMSWTTPPAWDTTGGVETAPPGRGKFLVKVGGRPGIPLQTRLTRAELALNDTNQRWRQQSRVGRAVEVAA